MKTKLINTFIVFFLIISSFISANELQASNLNLAIISDEYTYSNIKNLKEEVTEFKSLEVNLFSKSNLPDNYLFYAVQINDLYDDNIKNFVLSNLDKAFFIFIGKSSMGILSETLGIELLMKTTIFNSSTSLPETFIHTRDKDENFSVFLYTEIPYYLSLTSLAVLPENENTFLNYLTPTLELYSQIKSSIMKRASFDGSISAIYTNTATNTYFQTRYAVSRDNPLQGRQLYTIQAYTWFNKNGYSLDIEHGGNISYNAKVNNWSPKTGNILGNNSISINLSIFGISITMRNVRINAALNGDRTIKWSFINDAGSPWTSTSEFATVSYIYVDANTKPIFYIRTQGMDSTSHKSNYNIHSISIKE